MPLDLNQFNHDSLTAAIEQLRPGQSLLSNDGLLVRRRQNTSGYDCGIGAGGNAARRMNSAGEAAEDLLSASARFEHPNSLGGAARFEDVDKAIESVRSGETTPSGPSPAAKALRLLSRNTTLGSYRIRAQKARDALAKGDPAQAVRQLEAILEHANGSGKLRDVERAEAALAAVREHHEYEPGVPKLNNTTIEVRVEGSQHYVYQDGYAVTSGLSRSEADSRRAYLSRRAAREEDVKAINEELAGKPILVQRAEEAA